MNGWVSCASGSITGAVQTINFNKSSCGFTDFEKLRFNIDLGFGTGDCAIRFDGGPIRQYSIQARAFLDYRILTLATVIDLDCSTTGFYDIEVYRPTLDESIQGLNLPIAQVDSFQFSAALQGFVSGGLVLVLLIYFNGIEIFLTAFAALLKVLNVR